MSSSDYRIDRRDVDFTLYDHLQLQELLELPRYESFDRQTFELVLDNAEKFATEKLSEASAEADRQGCRLEDGDVYVPEVYEELYEEFRELGFFAPVQNTEHGGMGLPHTLGVALIEMFIGSDSSFMFTPGLTASAASLIEEYGTDEQVEMFCERMFTGEWTGTMCLTEPQAGSALGELKTSAEPVDGEDYFRIRGQKCFITAGDHQLSDNIVHLVLARAEGDPDGVRGISLFLVPSRRVEDGGTLGESNDVTITNIEEKMGIHASPTCQISFGDDDECRGWLVGERCQGLKQMFKMMNEARLVTGLQGVAIGNAALQSALEYARERVQGPKVTDRSDDKDNVPIIEHPDVRRNLMVMKAYGEGLRALTYHTAKISDIASYGQDDDEVEQAKEQLELLTPVCKAFCTDMGFRMTELAMQVHGGYGYIREYGIEQKMRDAKIASIYEGTNGIQALDLLGRKMRKNNGALFMNWVQEISGFLGGLTDHDVFGEMATEIDDAKNALSEAAFGFQAQGQQDPEYPLMHATPFLRMFGHIEAARLLLEQATVAHEQLEEIWDSKGIDPEDDEAREQLTDSHENVRYYENKIETARFFIYQLLPKVQMYLKGIQSNDRSALDITL